MGMCTEEVRTLSNSKPAIQITPFKSFAGPTLQRICTLTFMSDEDTSAHRKMQVEMAFTKKGWFGKIRNINRIQVWYKTLESGNCYIGFLEKCPGGELVIELTHGIHSRERYQVNYDGTMDRPNNPSFKTSIMTPRIRWWLK